MAEGGVVAVEALSFFIQRNSFISAKIGSNFRFKKVGSYNFDIEASLIARSSGESSAMFAEWWCWAGIPRNTVISGGRFLIISARQYTDQSSQ